jgi:hypothetical protein
MSGSRRIDISGDRSAYSDLRAPHRPAAKPGERRRVRAV